MPQLNACAFNPNTNPGTGDTIEIGSAIDTEYFTPSEAGAVDGQTYTWRADEGGDVEIFTAEYNTATPNEALADRTVVASRIGGTAGTSKMDLTTAAEIRQVVGKDDLPSDIPVPIADGGTGASTASGARSNLNVPGLDDVNTFTTNQQINRSGTGPSFNLRTDQNSANDVIGLLNFQGDNAAGDVHTYGALRGQIADPTTDAEFGKFLFTTIINGTITNIVAYEQGITVGVPTGGDQGQGTINAQTVYDDGVDVTCMALQFLETGKFDEADVAEWDAKVPDIVIPARTENEAVFENREVEEIIRDPNTKKLTKRRRVKRVPIIDIEDVYDAETGEVVGRQEIERTREVTIAEKVLTRRHEGAHRFKAMLDDGFDPRDPTAYLAKMRQDRALPGMPTEEEWTDRLTRAANGEKGAKISLGEMYSRMWLAVEFLALGFDNLHSRLAAVETRLAE